MRFLLASHLPPWPPVGGGQQRTYLLWRALKELGDVDFLLLVNRYNRREAANAKEWGPRFGLKALVEEPTWRESPLAKGLRRAGLGGLVHAMAYHRDGGRRLLAPSGPAVEATKRQLDPAGYDLIIGGYMRSVVTCGFIGGRVPVALDVDDYQPDLLRARLSHVDPVKRLTLKRQLRFTEKAWAEILPKCRHLWISMPEDRQHSLLREAGWLPNIPFVESGESPPEAPWELVNPKTLLVIGTWTYSANVVGLERFLNTAWKTIRRRLPSARLVVGGRIPERLISRWGKHPGVELAGFQSDLPGFYARGSAFIAPILFGAGTNIKVLEGSAFGRPGIVTRVAARGYGQTLAESGGLLVVDSVEEMADACLRLMGDSELAKQAGQLARKSVLEHYSWTRFRAAVEAGVREALS